MGCCCCCCPKPKPTSVVPFSPFWSPRSQAYSVENFIVVWLHATVANAKNVKKLEEQLPQTINVVKKFTEPVSCRHFIEDVTKEKIFLVVSDVWAERFLPTVRAFQQIDSIYIFCTKETAHQTWTSRFAEVCGVYSVASALCEQLGKDMKKCNHDLVGYNVVQRSSAQTTAKANQQEAAFMYSRLFRENLLSMKNTDITDLYTFGVKNYGTNHKQMKFLMSLKTTYSNHSPVWWYSQEAFLYSTVNKALRTHEYAALYDMRVFIRQLHEYIASKQKQSCSAGMTLYRGQRMDKEEFDHIRNNQGGLMSVSNFLSTSASREAALKFITIEELYDGKKERVLMKIQVNENTPVPVADIAGESEYKDEEEWLFSMGSVFRIGRTYQSEENFWIIDLTLTEDNDEELIGLGEYFRATSMATANPDLNTARFMHQLANWKEAQQFYHKSLTTENNEGRRAVILNDLGLIETELEQYDRALAYYNQSIHLKQEDNYTERRDIASTYNNMGIVHYKQKQLDRAMETFQEALKIIPSPTQGNQEIMASLYQNIAAVHNDRGEHEEALTNMKKCLQIRQTFLPSVHPTLATTYSGMASTYYYMQQFTKAVTYAQQAVDMDKKTLPPQHPHTQLHQKKLNMFQQVQADGEPMN